MEPITWSEVDTKAVYGSEQSVPVRTIPTLHALRDNDNPGHCSGREGRLKKKQGKVK